MRQRKVALIPTLKLWRYEARHDRAFRREQFTQTGVEQLRRWVASGGAVPHAAWGGKSFIADEGLCVVAVCLLDKIA
jgi:hypothetical protein